MTARLQIKTVVVVLLEFAKYARKFDFDLVRGPNDEVFYRIPLFDHTAFNAIAFSVVNGELQKEAGAGNLVRLHYTDFIDAESNEPIQRPSLLDQDRLYFLVTYINDENVGLVCVAYEPTELNNAPGLLF